jgi:hypothetical protein
VQTLTPKPERSASEVSTGRPARRMTDVHGAAAMYSVSWRSFLRWADSGLVPWGVKISGRRLWRIAELDEHIRDGCKPVRKGGR